MNRKTGGRTDESEQTRSGRRITGTAEEDGMEERARVWTAEAADGTKKRRGAGERSAESFALFSSRSLSLLSAFSFSLYIIMYIYNIMIQRIIK